MDKKRIVKLLHAFLLDGMSSVTNIDCDEIEPIQGYRHGTINNNAIRIVSNWPDRYIKTWEKFYSSKEKVGGEVIFSEGASAACEVDCYTTKKLGE